MKSVNFGDPVEVEPPSVVRLAERHAAAGVVERLVESFEQSPPGLFLRNGSA